MSGRIGRFVRRGRLRKSATKKVVSSIREGRGQKGYWFLGGEFRREKWRLMG